MLKTQEILTQAHSFFTARQYGKAIFLYSQVLSLDPTNREYQLYSIFCDIGSEINITFVTYFTDLFLL